MDGEALICMNCGATNLLYQHCKIRCQNCGFMLDCSDLDVGGEVKRAALQKTKTNPKSPAQDEQQTTRG